MFCPIATGLTHQVLKVAVLILVPKAGMKTDTAARTHFRLDIRVGLVRS
jgi:hypothetical protein